MPGFNNNEFDHSKLPFFQTKDAGHLDAIRNFYSFVLDNAADHVYLFRENSELVYLNASALRDLDYHLDELLGKKIWEWNPSFPELVWKRLWNDLVQKKHSFTEATSIRRSGRSVPIEVNSHYYEYEGEAFALCFSQDVSERKQAEETIRKQAYYDPLTGLANRNLLYDRLEHMLRIAKRDEQKFAVLFIDLDNFKNINDASGHDVGDELLRIAAQRIQGCVRDTDTVARFGGDEFIVLLANIDKPLALGRIPEQILRELAAPFEVNEEEHQISCSIGISLYPDDGRDIADLLKQADQAMYASKLDGKGNFTFFTKALQDETMRQRKLSNDLRSAFEKTQLRVYYLPVIDLANKRIHRAEALLRWKHDELGNISASTLIAVAQSNGTLERLGGWLTREISMDLETWQPHLSAEFQVNICEFADLAVSAGRSLGGEEGRPYTSQVAIEINESVLLSSVDGSLGSFQKLLNHELKLVLDTHKQRLKSANQSPKRDHVDILKVGQSFVQGLAGDEDKRKALISIIQMAHNLKLRVLAEGVESKEELELLETMGCDYVQGFYCKRPMLAEEFLAFAIDFHKCIRPRFEQSAR